MALQNLGNVELDDLTLDVNTPLDGEIDFFSFLRVSDNLLFNGECAVEIPDGVKLTLGAAQANDLTGVTGTGTLVVRSQDTGGGMIFFEPAEDSLANFQGTLVLAGSDAIVKKYLDDNLGEANLGAIAAALDLENATLLIDVIDGEITITDAEAANAILAGAGFTAGTTVTVTGSADDLAALLTPAVAKLTAAGAPVTFDAYEISVMLDIEEALALIAAGISFADGDGVDIVTTAANASEMNVDLSDFDSVTISDLELALDADLSGIIADDIQVHLFLNNDLEIAATAKLGTAAVLIQSAGSGTVTIADGAEISQASFMVTATNTLELTAEQANGLTVSGSGNLVITTPVGSGIDLSGIDSDTHVIYEGGFSYDEDTTLAADFVTEQTIVLTDGAKLTITGVDPGEAYDFDGISGGPVELVIAADGTLTAGNVVFDGEVDLTIEVPEGFTLTIGKTELDAVEGIGGAGNVVFVGATHEELTDDLAKLTVTGTISVEGADGESFTLTTLGDLAALKATGAGDITLTAAVAADLAKLTVDSGTITVTGADGQDFSLTATALGKYFNLTAPSGTVTVTGLESAPDADLSKITADTIKAELDSSGGVTISADAKLDTAAVTIGGNGTVTIADGAAFNTATFTVGENATLELTAAQADGLEVDGEGTVTIYANSDLGVDLSKIAATLEVELDDPEGQLNIKGDARLGAAAVTITSKTWVWVDEGADLGTATFHLAVLSTLSPSLAQANGLTVDGEGHVTIYAGGTDDLDVDLSQITAPLYVELEVGGTLEIPATAKLGTADVAISGSGTVTIAEGATFSYFYLGGGAPTLELTAAQANGLTVEGFGFVNITGAKAGEEYNFLGIYVGADDRVTVTYTTGGELADGTDLGSAVVEVASGVELTLTAEQAAELKITGAGKVIITGVDPTKVYDFDGITGVSVELVIAENGALAAENVTFGADVDLTIEVPEGFTLELTAAQADGLEVNGEGTVTITGLQDKLDADLSQITADTIEAVLDLYGGTVQIPAIANFGRAAVTIKDGTYVEVDEGADLGTATFHLEGGSCLTLSLAQANGRTVDGDGDAQIYANVSVNDDLNVDLSQITAPLYVELTVENALEIPSAANLGTADVKIYGNGTVTIADGAALNTAIFTVGGNVTLGLTAAQANGLTVEGSGIVGITGAEAEEEYDFSGIYLEGEDRVTVTYTTGGIFHPDTDLGTAAVVLTGGEDSPVRFTATVAQISGVTVTDTGTVELALTGWENAVNFATVLADVAFADPYSAVIALVTENIELSTANFDGIGQLWIEEGKTLTVHWSTTAIENFPNVHAEGEPWDALRIVGPEFGDEIDLSGVTWSDATPEGFYLTIDAGEGTDNIIGSDGIDHFVFASGDSGGAPINSDICDTIDGWQNHDAISFEGITLANAGAEASAGFAQIVDGVATFHADDDDLMEHIIAVANVIDVAGATTVFSYGAGGMDQNTYVFISDGVATGGQDGSGVTEGDVLIKLNGIAYNSINNIYIQDGLLYIIT